MYTILRIENLASDELMSLEARFKDLLPSSLKSIFFGKDKRLRVSNTYVLSDKYFWTDCQNDIIKLMGFLSPALTYANKLGALLTIDSAIFSIEYKGQITIEIGCLPILLKILSRHHVSFVLSVYPTEWKCTELGDVFHPSVTPRPMNCILHIHNVDAEIYDKFIERTRLSNDDFYASSENSFFNRHNRMLLSNEIGWNESHNKIIERLHDIQSALYYVSKLGASFSIDIPVDLNESRHYNLRCFSFTNEFVTLFADYCIEMNVRIIMDDTPIYRYKD